VKSVKSVVYLLLRFLGLASRLPRQHQSPEVPEVIAGTLEYMAPEQTGRMNRSIDWRSDLYSLGVTLYEMLVGALSFTASDPMKWVHCHLARQALSPSERVSDIPEPGSAIVMKLLSKTAEDRYQTAAGIEADLRRCLPEWEARGRIDPCGQQRDMLVTACRDLDQRSSKIREFASIEHLDTRIAFPVERGGARCAGLRSVCRGIEPQAEVVSMDSSRHGSERGIWKCVMEDDRSLNARQRNDESLNVKAADEPAIPPTEPISFDIPLVPGQAEWLIRHLDHEKIKVGVGRQTPDRNVHYFDWTDGFDSYSAVGVL